MTTYQLTAPDQIARLAQYAGVFLYSTLPLRSFGTDANIRFEFHYLSRDSFRAQATNSFYLQWSDATFLKTGVDVNGVRNSKV